MRKLASGLVLTFAVVLAVAGSGYERPRGRRWCAFYNSSTYNCGFHSYAQCYATIYGNGGWCRQNFFGMRPESPIGRGARLPAIDAFAGATG